MSDPRAELVTAEVALAGRLSPDQREAATRLRERLLAAHGAAWTAPVSGWAEHRFHAGAIVAIRTKASALLKNMAALFAVEPVTEITLTEASDAELCALAKRPEMARVARLSVHRGHSDDGATAVVSSPILTALASLSFGCVGPDLGREIARRKLPGLVVLALTDSELGDEGVAALAGAASLSALERLYLARTGLSDEAVTAIAGSKRLGALKTLCLGGNEGITDDCAPALTRGKALDHLVLLELNQTALGDEGARTIAQSQKLSTLRRLDVRQTGVTKVGFAALGQRRGLRVRW